MSRPLAAEAPDRAGVLVALGPMALAVRAGIDGRENVRGCCSSSTRGRSCLATAPCLERDARSDRGRLREELAVVELPIGSRARVSVREPERSRIEVHDHRGDRGSLLVEVEPLVGVAADAERVARVVGEGSLNVLGDTLARLSRISVCSRSRRNGLSGMAQSETSLPSKGRRAKVVRVQEDPVLGEQQEKPEKSPGAASMSTAMPSSWAIR